MDPRTSEKVRSAQLSALIPNLTAKGAVVEVRRGFLLGVPQEYGRKLALGWVGRLPRFQCNSRTVLSITKRSGRCEAVPRQACRTGAVA
eukprot:12593103-Alexandrium_andersonii.AAC.1